MGLTIGETNSTEGVAGRNDAGTSHHVPRPVLLDSPTDKPPF